MKDPKEASQAQKLITMISFVFPCFMLLAIFAIFAWTNSNASAINEQVEGKQLSGISSAILTTSDELTQKWFDQIGNAEWLYYSYKEELPGYHGVDLETNWLLPSQALWEVWYHFDANREIDIVLTQRTDLERGNIGQVVWTDGVLLRLPGNVREEDPSIGDYYPLRDHFCTTYLGNAQSLAKRSTSLKITESWTTGRDGVNRWEVIMNVTHPAVSGVAYDEDRTYIGWEVTCVRNSETGAVEQSENVAISIDGERVLRSRHYDYIVRPGSEPPAEILSLLEKLKEP